MKPAGLKYLILVVQLILISACAPQATPSSAPTEVPATQLVTVDLAGPNMEVGSTWLYADGTLLVPVPGGTFTMGAKGPDYPLHQVNLSDFWIYSTKVTNGQYAYCVSTGLCTPPSQKDNPTFNDIQHANDPMVGADYNQAVAYCNFVHARLPTEAEWEKTARGPNANIYPWGNGIPDCTLSNYGTCVGNTTPVTTYPTGQSYYHAFDMEGNVLEWVADRYQADYYLHSPTDNPPGPDKGQFRVVRSSAFNRGGDQTQAFIRSYTDPNTHRNNMGFRCVVEDPTYFASFCNYPATYGTNGIGGEAGGAQPVVDCPDLSITQVMQCNGTTPITYVTFGGSDNHSQDSCVPDPQVANRYDCSKDGTLSVCGNCKVTLTSDPQCPTGYTYDSETKTCLGHPRHGGGACLAGFTLTSVHFVRGNPPTPDASSPTATAEDQCCAFTPPALGGLTRTDSNVICEPVTLRSPTPACHAPFPSCPAGTTFDGQECISTTVQPFCKTEGVSFNSCTGGPGGEGTGNTQVCPGVSCDVNYKLDTSTCTCVCNGC